MGYGDEVCYHCHKERPYLIHLQQIEERPSKLKAFKGDEESNYEG